MLELKHGKKTFLPGTSNAHVAMDDLNLHLKKGDFVTIIGSNGAGKSTLFNAISGSFWLDAGQIILDGTDITYMKEHKRASMIGRLFQDPMKGTAPHMTIEENLALAYSRSRRSRLSMAVKKADSRLFRDALAEFDMGLEDRMDTRVGLLSGGQRQALTLLMSTIVVPKLLLLDEHTAALDPVTAHKVMEITNRIVERNGLTTMMITHNIQDALVTGNRTIMLETGKIIMELSGKERDEMTVSGLMEWYSRTGAGELTNDRMLLTKQ